MINILIPRNLDSRIEKRKQIDLKRIQEYIKNGSKRRLDLRKIPLTKLPDSLVQVGGNLDLSFSNIEDLNNLEYVGGNLWIGGTDINELPEGLFVGGWIHCSYTPLAKRFPYKSLFLEYLVERNIKIIGDVIL